MLEVIDIHKSFKGEPVLRGVSFVIPEAGVLGIYGSNGAGKTTLLNILAAIFPPDSGQVMMNGIRPEQRAYHDLVGFVPQNTALFQRLTVQQNLNFWASIRGFTQKELRQRVAEAAEMANVTSFLDKPVGRCSSGMARRANLAAGLIGTPPFILLDEPTAGIDEENRSLIFDTIGKLRKKGCLVVIVNHYYQELEGICDWIIQIKNGCMAASDS